MQKLHELLKKKLLKGDVGIEIECEGEGFKEIDSALWKSEDDGSLRGRYPNSRIEYVAKGPIPLDTVKHAITELNEHVKGCKPSFSYRTSVHVHVNVMDLTEVQLATMVYTYFLLESALFKFCGKTREANRFCLRLQDSDELGVFILKYVKSGYNYLTMLREDNIRYSAINLAAVTKYGSVEFRGMRGTLDVDTINIWATTLVSIRNFACNVESCLDVHDLFVEMGPQKFIEYVLKDLAEDMYRNFSLSIDIPYLVKNIKDNPPAKPLEAPPLAGLKPKLMVFDELEQALVPRPLIPKKPLAKYLKPGEMWWYNHPEWVVMDSVSGDFVSTSAERIAEWKAARAADMAAVDPEEIPL
jgi:hypothetical protein